MEEEEEAVAKGRETERSGDRQGGDDLDRGEEISRLPPRLPPPDMPTSRHKAPLTASSTPRSLSRSSPCRSRSREGRGHEPQSSFLRHAALRGTDPRAPAPSLCQRKLPDPLAFKYLHSNQFPR
jgi:hypothetical protein